MGILVCYNDFTYDVVNTSHLDFMIDADCIVGYDDSCNWEKVECDNLPEAMIHGRKNGRQEIAG